VSDYGTFKEQGETIRGIADHLAREQGKEQRDVWEEAEELFRVQFNTEILPPRSQEIAERMAD
jgi:hypothetical protein